MLKVLKKYFISLFDQPRNTPYEKIEIFRQRLLVSLLLCMCIFGSIAYIPSVYYGYIHHFNSIVFMDTLALGAGFFLLFRKRMNYKPRALGLLIFFYILGVWLLVVLGPTGAGFMWLLLFSIMSGVLLGFTSAVVSLSLNLVTVAVLSVLVFKEMITWTFLPEIEIAVWIVKSVNFICINAIVAVSIGFIIARISRTAKEETIRRIRLDQEIQARIRTEKENKALTERLYQSQKMEAMGTLAGGIAHDFNNILSAIVGYTELSKMENGLPESVASYLNKISQASSKAKGITSQILTFGRHEVILKVPEDLELITRECVDLIKVGIPAGVELSLDIKEGPFPVIGDRNQLFQVIMNLLTNGMQAMDNLSGTHVKRLSLSLSPMPESISPQKYGLQEGAEYHVLKVTDTGTGIPQEYISKIFDPYFTTKKSGKGTGLGLSITHSIIKDHGGEILVESTSEKGTCFTVFLPLVKMSAAENENNKICTVNGTEVILMVDDDPEVLEVHSRFLKKYGYRVHAADNPDSALDFLRDHMGAIDLIISDHKMPGITGDNLESRIRTICPDIPVILCSGFMDKNTDYSGFNAVLNKPVTPEQLAQTVRMVIDKCIVHKG